MITIYKYPLQVTSEQTIDLPIGAKLLTVQTQNSTPCLWAMIRTSDYTKKIKVFTFGAGHPIPFEFQGDYLGTYQLEDGRLVFHVFTRWI